MTIAYILLAIAIICEVFGSSMLKLTNGFKRPLPTIGVILGYSAAFYALSFTLQTIEIGVAYAIWSGAGTALTAIIGTMIYKEHLNQKKIVGLLCIIAGVIVININQ